MISRLRPSDYPPGESVRRVKREVKARLPPGVGSCPSVPTVESGNGRVGQLSDQQAAACAPEPTRPRPPSCCRAGLALIRITT